MRTNDSGSAVKAELLLILNVVSDDATLPKSFERLRLQQSLRSSSVNDLNWLSEPDSSCSRPHLQKHTLSSRCTCVGFIKQMGLFGEDMMQRA
jgi:hypothetical protein